MASPRFFVTVGDTPRVGGDVGAHGSGGGTVGGGGTDSVTVVVGGGGAAVLVKTVCIIHISHVRLLSHRKELTFSHSSLYSTNFVI